MTIVGGGWFGDVLKGDCLAFAGILECAKNVLDYRGVVISLVIFAIGAFLLITTSRTFIPVRQLRSGALISAHRALILNLSSVDDVDFTNESKTITKGGITVTLTGNIDQDILSLEPLKINIQQVLRAVAPHINRLTHLVLIGSEGEKGSAKVREPIAKLLSLYVKNVDIDYSSDPVNFESLEDLQGVFSDSIRVLEDIGVVTSEIMIDVTGGQKTTSIAAAMATLHQPRLQFQYVSTLKPHSVVAYDVVTETQARLS